MLEISKIHQIVLNFAFGIITYFDAVLKIVHELFVLLDCVSCVDGLQFLYGFGDGSRRQARIQSADAVFQDSFIYRYGVVPFNVRSILHYISHVGK